MGVTYCRQYHLMHYSLGAQYQPQTLHKFSKDQCDYFLLSSHVFPVGHMTWGQLEDFAHLLHADAVV